MNEEHKYHHKMFESAAGSVYSPLKLMGENSVPVGCQYDPSERSELF